MATYAIVNDRGRRHRVSPGDVILIDLRKDAEPGSAIVFDQIELVSTDGAARVGAPTVSGVKVHGVVKGETKGEKIVVFVYRRRKSSRRKHGSRPRFTRVAIGKIEA